MKLLTLLIITIIGMFSSSFPGGGDPSCCFKKEHFMKEAWYSNMCTELSKQNKIDANAAYFIRMTSSNSEVGKQSDETIIKQHGSISPAQILMICRVPEDQDKVYIVTNDNQFHYLFSFETKTHIL